MTDIEPCCPPGLCDFRVERVRLYLHIIKTAQEMREDPVDLAQSILKPRGERHMGRSGPCSTRNQDELCITDVQDKLKNGYALSTPEKIAAACCPFSTDGCAKLAASGTSAP